MIRRQPIAWALAVALTGVGSTPLTAGESSIAFRTSEQAPPAPLPPAAPAGDDRGQCDPAAPLRNRFREAIASRDLATGGVGAAPAAGRRAAAAAHETSLALERIAAEAPPLPDPARAAADPAASAGDPSQPVDRRTSTRGGRSGRERQHRGQAAPAAGHDASGRETQPRDTSVHHATIRRTGFHELAAEPIHTTAEPAPPRRVARIAQIVVAEVPQRDEAGQSSPAGEGGSGRGGRGTVARVNARDGIVTLNFAAGEAPAVGQRVKAYHRYLLHREYCGELEVIDVDRELVTARTIGDWGSMPLARGDDVVSR